MLTKHHASVGAAIAQAVAWHCEIALQDPTTSGESIVTPKQAHTSAEGGTASPGGGPWQSLVAVAVLDAGSLFQNAAAQLEEEGAGAPAPGLSLAELAGPDGFHQLAAMSDFALLSHAPSGVAQSWSLSDGTCNRLSGHA